VRIVVWLQGEHDPTTAARLADRLTNAAALGQGNVVVDLSEVQSMDGATVQVLACHQQLLGSQSRRLTLRAPSPSAQRLLEVCGLAELIDLP
jgi:anti-anti-sigma factor